MAEIALDLSIPLSILAVSLAAAFLVGYHFLLSFQQSERL
jgi:hypothetical protein